MANTTTRWSFLCWSTHDISLLCQIQQAWYLVGTPGTLPGHRTRAAAPCEFAWRRFRTPTQHDDGRELKDEGFISWLVRTFNPLGPDILHGKMQFFSSFCVSGRPLIYTLGIAVCQVRYTRYTSYTCPWFCDPYLFLDQPKQTTIDAIDLSMAA